MTFSDNVWNFEICQQQKHSFTSSIFFAKITESAISERKSEGYNQIVPLGTIKPWKILIKKNKVIWHPFSKRWPKWWTGGNGGDVAKNKKPAQSKSEKPQKNKESRSCRKKYRVFNFDQVCWYSKFKLSNYKRRQLKQWIYPHLKIFREIG